MAHDIFISYSRRNLKKVQPIKEELESRGFSCWMDLEGIESGSEEFTTKIAQAINGSKAVFFFLSRASQKSPWSLNELRLSRNKKKHVVIVRFNDNEMIDTFQLEFGGSDIIDWRIPEQMDKLLKDLSKWTKKSLLPPRRNTASASPSTMKRSDTSCSSSKPKSATSKPKNPPISIEFKYYFEVLGVKLYFLEVSNHGRVPIEIVAKVKNGKQNSTFREIIPSHSKVKFTMPGGTWRFKHGDQGTIKVSGWSKQLKFGLDSDGYWQSF